MENRRLPKVACSYTPFVTRDLEGQAQDGVIYFEDGTGNVCTS